MTVPYFPFAFPLQYPNIVGIPDLRTRVRDDTADNISYNENTDYILDTGNVLAFKQMPPAVLWGKRNFVNQETPWNNFGFLMGIYQSNTAKYLSVIQGLWHAFWVGPKPTSIQTSLYLLFGLPVAAEDCVVQSITATAVTTVSLVGGITREYPIPMDLVPVVSVGQTLIKYSPIVSGIEVYDKINLPGFITTEIGRIGIQHFLTQNASRGTGDTDETKALRLLEEHTFLPQISVNAFISPDINLGNVKQFLGLIRPMHKTFLSQIIVGEFKDPIVLQDQIGFDIDIDVTPNLDSNQTTFLDPTISHMGTDPLYGGDAPSLISYETSDIGGLDLDIAGGCCD
jgi:hypothetical protein